MTRRPWSPTHRFTKQPLKEPLAELSWFTLEALSDAEAYIRMITHFPDLGWSQLQRRSASGAWEFCT